MRTIITVKADGQDLQFFVSYKGADDYMQWCKSLKLGYQMEVFVPEKEVVKTSDVPAHLEALRALDTFKGNETRYIKAVLSRFSGNQRQSAVHMEIPKSTLHDKIKKHNISVEVPNNANLN
jgi:DNA-binding NtrC family response regulator